MKLDLNIQGYFTADEFLKTLEIFQKRALDLFNSDLDEHEELINLGEGNFVGKISIDTKNMEEDKNDPFIVKIFGEVLSELLGVEEDEALSFPPSFINNFVYETKNRFKEYEENVEISVIILEILNEKKPIKVCNYCNGLITEGLVSRGYYFHDINCLTEEQELSGIDFSDYKKFKSKI